MTLFCCLQGTAGLVKVWNTVTGAEQSLPGHQVRRLLSSWRRMSTGALVSPYTWSPPCTSCQCCLVDPAALHQAHCFCDTLAASQRGSFDPCRARCSRWRRPASSFSAADTTAPSLSGSSTLPVRTSCLRCVVPPLAIFGCQLGQIALHTQLMVLLSSFAGLSLSSQAARLRWPRVLCLHITSGAP